MKRQKGIKLAFISLLANPDVLLEDYLIDREMIQQLDGVTSARYTGRETITLTIVKHEPDTTDKKQTGAAKGKKGSDSKRPQPPPDRIETNG